MRPFARLASLEQSLAAVDAEGALRAARLRVGLLGAGRTWMLPFTTSRSSDRNAPSRPRVRGCRWRSAFAARILLLVAAGSADARPGHDFTTGAKRLRPPALPRALRPRIARARRRCGVRPSVPLPTSDRQKRASARRSWFHTTQPPFEAGASAHGTRSERPAGQPEPRSSAARSTADSRSLLDAACAGALGWGRTGREGNPGCGQPKRVDALAGIADRSANRSIAQMGRRDCGRPSKAAAGRAKSGLHPWAAPADGEDRWRLDGRPGGPGGFGGAGGAMVQINMAAREITLKVVYYGPALSGKTTNLQQLHQLLDPASRGKMVTLDTTDDRTLYFDFLPIQFGAGLRRFGEAQALHGARAGDAQVDAQGRARGRRRGRVHRRLAARFGLRERLLVARHGSQPPRQQHRLRRESRRSCSSTSATFRTSSRSRRFARPGARSRPSRPSR